MPRPLIAFALVCALGAPLLTACSAGQDTGGDVRGRRSVALMRQSATAPNGVEWVRVEETWIE